ncbi:MAG: hypothetical protein J2P17_30395, partial [Mycobacterium sp.]|nr:hypothetical protein [Mycobacterium sp.]
MIRSTVGVLIVALLLAGAAGCASRGVPVGGGASLPTVQQLPTVPLPTPATMARQGVTYQVMAVAPEAAMHDAA